VIALSSIITEIITFDTAVKEVLYIRKLAISLGLREDDKPLLILSNSDNAIKMVKKPNLPATPSARWLDNKWFFVHELVQAKKVEFKHINGSKNIADGLTKPLNRPAFDFFQNGLNMVTDEGRKED
jgi:hypothetical protein